MRKTITKEIKFTSFKLTTTVIEDGEPKLIHLKNDPLLGELSAKKISKLMKEKYNKPVTCYDLKVITKKYTLPVETFLKYATESE